MIYRVLRWWFTPSQWIDGLRRSEWNTEQVRAFRVAVARRIADDGKDQSMDFRAYANRMKWRKEWRGMYLRSQALVWAWYAALTVECFPFVAAPFALVWWLQQHLTVSVGWH